MSKFSLSNKMPAPLVWTARRVSAPMRALPDFIIIGAQKCGTSSLYSYLIHHPQVRAAWRKEIHYFDSPEYAEGIDWYRAHFPFRVSLSRNQKLEGHRILTGESSPYYLAHPHAHQRVFENLPQAKLIVMLRNPIDRALSHYNHQVRKGREPFGFEEAIGLEKQRLGNEKAKMLADAEYYSYNYWAYSYQERGHYIDQIETWLKKFQREQMLFVNSDKFFEDPRKVFKQVLGFLELDDYDLGAYSKQNAGSYDGMPPSFRQYLGDYFRPYNTRLYEFLDCDYHWC